jgi:acetyl esterase/lipase
MSESSAGSVRTISYGTEPAQVGKLYLPAGHGPFPVVVLLHGGYWTALGTLDQTAPLAEDLRQRGYAAWNVEYRSIGVAGGGWPGTFTDVATAVDLVVDLDPSLDPRRVVTIGHSAGGQLAIWAASRTHLPEDAPGHGPKVQPIGAVSLAGVLDLVAADADRAGSRMGDPSRRVTGAPPLTRPDLVGSVTRLVGDGTLPVLLGGHASEFPERYAWASPTTLGSGEVPVLAVHGTEDDAVPISYGRSYYAAARARREPVEFREIPGAHHFTVLDPANPSWSEIAKWIAKRFAESAR